MDCRRIRRDDCVYPGRVAVTFFDAAEVYGPFANELVKCALAPVREEGVMATTFGLTGAGPTRGLPRTRTCHQPQA